MIKITITNDQGEVYDTFTADPEDATAYRGRALVHDSDGEQVWFEDAVADALFWAKEGAKS